jgi:hypothetical protein
VAVDLRDRAQHAQRFARHLGADAVAGQDGDVQFHLDLFPRKIDHRLRP